MLPAMQCCNCLSNKTHAHGAHNIDEGLRDESHWTAQQQERYSFTAQC